ncbi:MAG: GntR family transcriptional regulator, partial [Clostridiaceae bacterium]|nr:GntR family transcriptional regulator [Clostridiaceae bacterium]
MNESLLTKKEGLSDQAYREIKSMILTNQLGPGAILNEAQFQEILGIGRTPVREAIIQLSQEGFLIVHPRRGMEVARISPKRIKDIFEIRYLIEPQILRMGFDKIDRSWLSSMREEFLHYINNGLDLSREDTIRLSELDNELHMGIIDSV